MTRKKKPLYWMLCITFALLATVLAGCSSNGNTGGQEQPGIGSPGAGGSGDGEQVSLTFGHFRVNNEGIDKVFLNTLETFRQDHPNVTIDEEAVAHDPYRQKMTTLGASGALPDIFMANGSMIIDYAGNNFVMPWDDLIKQDTEWSEGFLDGAFDDFVVGGVTYGVPIKMASVHTIYYNEEIFKEAGISEFPQTWDELLAAVDQLKQAGYIPIAMGNKSNVPVGSTLFSTLADRVTGTEWFNGLETGESKFTDPEFVEALNKMKDLVDAGAFNEDINSIDESQGEALYYNKQAAMMISGSWFVSRIVENAPQDVADHTKFGLLPPIPGGEGEARAVAGGGGWSYAINANLTGVKKETAIEIVKALSNDTFAKSQKEVNDLPARAVAEYDKTKLSNLANEYSDFLEGVKYTPVYDIRLKPALVEVLYRGVQELMIGVTTPDEIAQRAQAIQDQP